MNTRKIWLTFVLCLMVHLSGAQNPIIRHQFSAAPTARVFDEKYMFTRRTTFPVPLNG